MCCGNSNKKAAAKAAARAVDGRTTAAQARAYSTFSVGADGMVEIEYQLPKAGTITYTGAVTHQQYAFSLNRKRGWVDARDAPAFLARIEDRRRAFILVYPTAPPATVTPPYEQIVNAPAPVVPEAKATEEIIITETVPQADTPKPRKTRKS